MPLTKDERYTIADINSLPEGTRVELIDGKIYYQASLSRTHQIISKELVVKIDRFIKSNKGKCEVYPAPFDVFLNKLTFATKAAEFNVDNYEKKIFDFYEYPLGVNFIGVRKELIKNKLDAFIVLFMLDLRYQNDWIYSEEERQSTEQWIVERLTKEEWIDSLSKFHIEDYFSLKYRNLNIVEKAVNEFQREFLHWTPENAPEEELLELKEELASTKWVYSLFPDAFYDKYFGETEHYFFFAESGVYD